MLLRNTLTASCCLAASIAIGPAFAQAPAPRDVPDGFVLPGPPPTNAPSETGSAPAAPSPSAGQALVPSAPPQVPVTGTMAAPPPALLPGAGTTTRLSGGAPSRGQRHEWPCIQRKVDAIGVGQVWQGPPLETADGIARTEEMRLLVEAIAQRRVPLAEAQARASAYVEALPEPDRPSAATALFADLFRRLNAERADIMRGIERYGARQQALAAKLRADNAELSTIRASGDAASAAAAQEALIWDTRIFDERRRSLTYVCEVPTLIEQRLFGLGRVLSETL